MVTIPLLLCGLALLWWPDTRSAARLRVIAGAPTRRRRLRHPQPSAVTVIVAAAATGWLIASAGGAMAAALLTATASRQLHERRRLRQSLAAVDGLAEALRSLVAGLRAGAHPAEAAESAAADAPPQAAATMRAVAAAARLDGDVGRALGTTSTPTLTTVLRRVAKAWTLAQRHGLPLAEVLDAVRRDLDQRTRFARQVLARMAGPRSSATVLSLLPVLGVALGEAMGARPFHLLTNTTTGQLLLVVGVTLLCAGVLWCGHLTNQAVLHDRPTPR
jgi:tight adherence protein B